METVTWVDFRKGWERSVIELRRSIREGIGQGPTTTPVMVSTSRDCQRDADRIKAAQSEVLRCLMRRDLKGAEERSATAGRVLAEARAAWKFDPMIQYNLRGYHCENEFVWRNWDAINGGQAPAHDPLLKEARECFIRWLWVDPFDPYALNGVGNVLFYSRHLRAAACFTGWALSMVDSRDVPTDVRRAFEHDCDTMVHFLKMSECCLSRYFTADFSDYFTPR